MLIKFPVKFLFICTIAPLVIYSLSCHPAGEQESLSVLSRTLRFDSDIVAAEQIPLTRWKSLRNNLVNCGYETGACWLRIQTISMQSPAETLFLVVESSDIDQVSLFRKQADGSFTVNRAGNSITKREKAWSSAEPIIPIAGLDSREVIYAKIVGDTYKKFPVHILTGDEFQSRKDRRFTIQAIFLAFCFVIVIVNFYFSFHKHSLSPFFVSFFVAINVISLWSGFGNALEIIWPVYPLWRSQIHYFLCAIALVFAGLHLREAAGAAPGSPPALVFSVVTIVSFLGGLVFLNSMPFYIRFSGYFLLLCLNIAVFLPITRIVEGRSGPLFWAWLIFFGGWTLSGLFYAGLFPYHPLLPYGGAIVLPVTGFLLTLHGYASAPRSPDSKTGIYSRSKLQGVDVEKTLRLLEHIIEEKKPYRNSDLRLENLASMLSIAPYQLSELLNNHLGYSFRRFINRLRVEEAQRSLVRDPVKTVLQVGMEAGFDTKSNFNRVFKEQTGKTPSHYRQEAAKKENENS